MLGYTAIKGGRNMKNKLEQLSNNIKILKKNGLADAESIDLNGNFKCETKYASGYFDRYGYEGKIVDTGVIYILYSAKYEDHDKDGYCGEVPVEYLIGKNISGYNFEIDVTGKEKEQIKKYTNMILKCLENNVDLEFLKNEINSLRYSSIHVEKSDKQLKKVK